MKQACKRGIPLLEKSLLPYFCLDLPGIFTYILPIVDGHFKDNDGHVTRKSCDSHV